MSAERDNLLRFAKDLADPDWSLSVPMPVKRVIRKLVDIIEAGPRTITTVEELDALPRGSVVLDRDGLSLHLSIDGWSASNGTRGIEREELERETFPATVLHEAAS